MGSRLLPGFDANGLSEHIQGDGFLSGLELAITAKTLDILQVIPRRQHQGCKYEYCLCERLRRKYIKGFRPISSGLADEGAEREPICALGTTAGNHALCCDEGCAKSKAG
jgi:hypothetical protein